MTYFIVAWIAMGFTVSSACIASSLDDNESVDWLGAIMLLLVGPLIVMDMIVKVLTKKK